MKKLIYSAFIMCGLLSTSCTNLLELESKTSVTTDYVFTTTEGVQSAVVGLYYLNRQMPGDNDNSGNNQYILYMADYQTDIICYDTSQCSSIARIVDFETDDSCVDTYWDRFYNIIGKANEIIEAAESLGQNDSGEWTDDDMLQAWAEAKFFRGYSYFKLWERFDRLFLNLEATNIDNLDREFYPADNDVLQAQITLDLTEAAELLDWSLPVVDGSTQYGRVTKAVPLHYLAEQAMWQEDWDAVVDYTEQIFNSGYHTMEANAYDVFGCADMTSSEALWIFPYSLNSGGGTDNGIDGHRVCISLTPAYRQLDAFVMAADLGGYGWSRMTANTRLLSLYESTDTRLETLFHSKWVSNNPDSPYYGQEITPDMRGNTYDCMKTQTRKYIDYGYTLNGSDPEYKTSTKDLNIIRLAHTYIMAAEAYMMKGDQTNALRCYNMTYGRANSPRTEAIDIQDILDETARELHMEGVRWLQLKRLGLLAYYCNNWEGDTNSYREEYPLASWDEYLPADFAYARGSFVEGKHENWPIPQDILDLIGEENFPQNPGW